MMNFVSTCPALLPVGRLSAEGVKMRTSRAASRRYNVAAVEDDAAGLAKRLRRCPNVAGRRAYWGRGRCDAVLRLLLFIRFVADRLRRGGGRFSREVYLVMGKNTSANAVTGGGLPLAIFQAFRYDDRK